MDALQAIEVFEGFSDQPADPDAGGHSDKTEKEKERVAAASLGAAH